MAGESGRLPQQALRVADLERSIRFYRDRMGFAVTESSTGKALLAGPGGATVLLATAEADLSAWEGVPLSPPGAWVYVYRPDLPEVAEELRGRGMAGLPEPEEPYPGFRQLQVADPDGYVVTFWEPLPVTDEQVLAIYRDGPARLREAVYGLTDAQLDRPWAPGKWTLRQIVHHVVDSDLSTFEVIRMALALPGRQIQTNLWSPDNWMTGLRCDQRPIAPALALLEAARAWVLQAVEYLPGALERSVTWPSGYRASVRDLLRQVGGHALHHIRQIESVRNRGR